MLDFLKFRPPYVFVFAVLLILTADLWQQGMFMDGVYYASIARNLAEGDGSFWNLHFTKTLHADFYEQPPLAMFLQSLWFRVLGDSIYVERAYSFTVLLLNIFLIAQIWKQVIPDPKWKTRVWVPLLLWLSVYSITWAARNNMLENTMMLFVFAAVWAIFKSSRTKKWWFLSLAGACIFGALLSKGPASLYVLALPVLLGIFRLYPSKSWGLVESVYLVGCVLLGLLLIFQLSPGGRAFLESYYETQVLRSVLQLKNVDSRSYILQRYIAELGYALGITLLLLVIAKAKKLPLGLGNKKMVLALVLFALCGVLPIMVSWRQRTYYVNSTFIWVCFALAMPLLPLLAHWGEKLKLHAFAKYMLRYGAYATLPVAAAILIYTVRSDRRDEVLLHDVKQLTQQFPEGTIFSCTTELYFAWANPAYLYRLGHISLTDRERLPLEYSTLDSLPGYRRISKGTLKYHVFEKTVP